jgi:hypothetical protein
MRLIMYEGEPAGETEKREDTIWLTKTARSFHRFYMEVRMLSLALSLEAGQEV